MKPYRLIEVPEASQFRRLSIVRPGSGAVAVLVLSGDPAEVDLFLSSIRAAIDQTAVIVGGPKPCLGCGDR